MRRLILLLITGLLVPAAAMAVSPVRSLLRENRLEEAAAVCRQFEVLTTSDPDNFVACAWVYYRSNRIASGDAMVDKAKGSASGPQGKLLSAFRWIQLKKFEQAREILDELSKGSRLGGFGVQVQLIRAELYEAQGNLDTAAFIYKQVVADAPREGRAHWGLGRYYLSRNDLNRARTHLMTTAQVWPKHQGARFNLAVLYLNQDDFSQAARWLGQAYRLDKSDPGVLEQMGVLFEKKGMLDKAIKYWQRALTLNSEAPLAKEKIAKYSSHVVDALMQGQQWGQALTKLEQQPEAVFKAAPELRLKRGIIYRNLGQHKKAIEDLQAFSKAQPGNALAFRELGICFLNMNLPNQAGPNFVKAMDLEPGNGLNYAWVAFILEGKGQLEEAQQAWQKAVSLLKDPDELKKATRRLATVNTRLKRRAKHEQHAHDEEDMEDRIDRQFGNLPE